MACNFQTINGVLNVYDDQGNPSQLYKDAVSKFGENTAMEIYLASQSDEFKDVYNKVKKIDLKQPVEGERILEGVPIYKDMKSGGIPELNSIAEAYVKKNSIPYYTLFGYNTCRM